MRLQGELHAEALKLGLQPVKLDGPDDRVTGDQLQTFESDLGTFPDEVGLLGFNDAGWLVYYVQNTLTAVSPEGNAYMGRDAHLRRFEDEEAES